jgi:predicted Fe-S protein YdhL (DUF1289 family)
MEDPPSPCIKVCAYDEETGLCRGCLRTLDEIAAWGSLGNDEKIKILERIEVRRKRVALQLTTPQEGAG